MAKQNTITDHTFEVITNFLREFFTDVRQKVVEEPTYGRSVTPELSRESPAQSPEQPSVRPTAGQDQDIASSSERRRSFAEQLSERSSGLSAPAHEQDHGIDH